MSLRSDLNNDLPAYVRRILADPKSLHDLARTYDISDVKQLENKWVLWWCIYNPPGEWCADKVVGAVLVRDGIINIYFKLGLPRQLDSTLFYIIPES